MIKPLKIVCPECGKVSELYLSVKPTVVVLDCPKCWSHLMYDRLGARHYAPPPPPYIPTPEEIERFLSLAPFAPEKQSISQEDIVELKQQLNETEDVLDFIKTCG